MFIQARATETLNTDQEMKMRHALLYSLVAMTLFSDNARAAVHRSKVRHAGERPNIIVVFTDDQGFADIGAHGQVTDIKTPHLDALARDGITCTSGYITAPQCGPSRAGLMTGRYQQRFGFDHNGLGSMPLSEKTLGDRLRKAGYVTGMVGKWHLGFEGNHTGPGTVMGEHAPYNGSLMPAKRGFDEYWCGHMLNYAASYDLQGNAFPDAPPGPVQWTMWQQEPIWNGWI